MGVSFQLAQLIAHAHHIFSLHWFAWLADSRLASIQEHAANCTFGTSDMPMLKAERLLRYSNDSAIAARKNGSWS